MSMSRLRRIGRLVRGGTIMVVFLASAGCWWQQPGAGPENTRHNPFEQTLTPANVSGLTQKWSVEVPGTVPEPVTSGQLVFVSHNVVSQRTVTALDVASGTTAWQRALPTAVSTDPTPVAYSGDELWVSQVARFPFTNPICSDLTRLDPHTGEILGTRAIELPTTGFVTSGSVVAYIDSRRCTGGQGNARLVVLDRTTSTVSWTAPLSGTELTDAPVISGGRIYVNGQVFEADGCGAAVCSPLPIDASPEMVTGGRMFSFDAVHIEQPPPDPVLIDFATILVHAADSGRELWRDNWGEENGPHGSINGISVAGNTLYVAGWLEDATGARPGRLAAYPVAGCGAPVCEPSWTAPGPRLAGQPAVAGKVVYTLSDETLTAYDARGCGAPTCEPLATIPTEAERFIVSAGHVLLLEVTGLGTSDVATTITALGLP